MIRLFVFFVCAAITSHAAPSVVETPTSIEVDNGVASFLLSKKNATINSLKLGERETLGHGGYLYYTANLSAPGGAEYWRMGKAQYAIRKGDDFVDVTMHQPSSTAMPLDVTVHYFMRTNEPGFHVYVEFAHHPEFPDRDLEQTCLILRGDKTIFNYHSVTEKRFGVMPTPEELSAAKKLQDATFLLPAGTEYESNLKRRVYTKYDWSVEMEDRPVIGLYGNNLGVWIVKANRESYSAGPAKQELTIHQEKTPVLNGMFHSAHYGLSPQIKFTGQKKRNFGPYFIMLTEGTDLPQSRKEAEKFNDINVHQAFYDSVGLPGWVSQSKRSRVMANLKLDGKPVEGAMVVLSDNKTNFQFSREGFQYWTKTDQRGEFAFSGVRPGVYRITAYAAGTYGEFIKDDLSIAGGKNLNLGTLDWRATSFGKTLWQVGIFDRTAVEFRHGAKDDYRRYGLIERYPKEFPTDVRFVVGKSSEARDWNYIHWETPAEGHSPIWKIEFPGPSFAKGPVAILTVALASQTQARLNLSLNGKFIAKWEPTASLPAYLWTKPTSPQDRSGIRSVYQSKQFRFDASHMVEGTNTLELSHAEPASTKNTRGIIYDAIRLEVKDTEIEKFTDADLFSLIKRNSQGVIYIDSPSMELSETGLTEIKRATQALKLPLTVLHHGKKQKDGMSFESRELMNRGALDHFPTIFVYSNGKLSTSLPGYRDKEGYIGQIQTAVMMPAPAPRPKTKMSALWEVRERVKLPEGFKPYSWYKIFPNSRWAMFSTNHTSYKANVFLNLDTGKTYETPHPGLTPVPSPDGKFMVTYWPTSGRGMIFYDLASIMNGKIEAFAEKVFAPDYHTVGQLSENKNKSSYRILNGNRGDIRGYDFEVDYSGATPVAMNFSPVVHYCQNMVQASLPMINKKGTRLVLRADSARSTMVVNIPEGGGACELVQDLGYGTGKGEFTYDDAAIVYHLKREVSHAYRYDLATKEEIQISADTDDTAEYPFTMPDGDVWYLNQGTQELVHVALKPH